MQVGEQQIGIVLERVEHAVAVMRIDVDISDALHAVPTPQHFDRHAAVVEDAKAGGVAARRMMQTGNRNECAARGAAEHSVDGVQRRADDVARGFVDAAPGRRVACVEIAEAARRTLAHEIDVGRRVKPFELFTRSGARDAALDAPVQSALVQLAHECFVPVGPERVAVAEAVARDLVARHQEHIAVRFRHGGPFLVCAPPPPCRH